MVLEITVSRTIAATAQEIWDALTQIDHLPERLRSVESVRRVTQGQYAVGTRWRRVRSLLGRSEEHEMHVISADPPHHTVIESEFAGIGYRLEIHLSESGDHTESKPRIRVRMTVRDHPPQADPNFLQLVLGNLGARATEETLAQDLADLAAAVEHPDTQVMVVIHRLFTRELAAGPDLVHSVGPGDRERAGVVADHLTVVLNALVDHHHGEDVLLWPLLRTRVTLSDELMDRMEEQHSEIHEGVDDVRALLTTWRRQADLATRDRLAAVLGQLAESLRTHLAQEEADMLPLVEQHLTRVEYARLVEHGREALPKDKAATLVQLCLEGTTPTERALLIADFPRATQLMINTLGARQYRRYVRRLRTP